MKTFFQVDEIKPIKRKKNNSVVESTTQLIDNSLPNWFTNIQLLRKKYNEIEKLNDNELLLFLDNKNFDERCQYILGLVDYCLEINSFPSLKKYKEELLYLKKINKQK